MPCPTLLLLSPALAARHSATPRLTSIAFALVCRLIFAHCSLPPFGSGCSFVSAGASSFLQMRHFLLAFVTLLNYCLCFVSFLFSSALHARAFVFVFVFVNAVVITTTTNTVASKTACGALVCVCMCVCVCVCVYASVCAYVCLVEGSLFWLIRVEQVEVVDILLAAELRPHAHAHFGEELQLLQNTKTRESRAKA